MMTKEEIGSIIKRARLATGLTQAQVAKHLNRPQQTVANWEVGRSQPDANTLFELFRVLNADMNEAFGFSAPKKEAPSDLSEEALQVARDFHKLDERGKRVIKAVLSCESEPIPSQQEQDSAVLTFPKAKKSRGMIEIDVYDQPAAAGLGNYLDEPPFHVEQYPADVIPPKADFGIIISGDSMEPKVHDGGTVFVQAAPTIDAGKIGIFVLNGKSYCKKLAVDRENRQIRLVSLNGKYEDIVVGEFDQFYTVGRVLGQWTPGRKQDFLGW